MLPYYSPHTNEELISKLHLQRHPEGGYFLETDRQNVTVSSPFAQHAKRPLATSIYYLLTYEERAGKFHMNKSLTYHVLHHGRAEYTLIKPSSSGGPPEIEKVIMGNNVEAGEQRLLIVEGGVWKKSAIPEEDIRAAEKAAALGDHQVRERTCCLITEVVTPGFVWEDHKFMTEGDLVGLFKDRCEVEKWSPFLAQEQKMLHA